MDTDEHRWERKESGVRGQEFGDLKAQASSLKPSFATDEHGWTLIGTEIGLTQSETRMATESYGGEGVPARG